VSPEAEDVTKDAFLTREEELEVVERGCAHPEKTNRTLSYRTDSQIISLTENVCAGNLCNRPRPGK
jgi:plasminogen activator (urokinase receptor)